MGTARGPDPPPPPAPGMSKAGIWGAEEGLGLGMRCCLGQRVGRERRGVRGAGPGAQQEQQYGAGNGSPARSVLSGRPFWALEAASSSLGAAGPIPASISQLSDCIGLFLEDGRRTGGVRKGGTCLGKGGVGTPSCEAAAPPASPPACIWLQALALCQPPPAGLDSRASGSGPQSRLWGLRPACHRGLE